MCVCARVCLHTLDSLKIITTDIPEQCLLPRCFSCLLIAGDNDLAAMRATWAKALGCAAGTGTLSAQGCPGAGGLCWSATYWSGVLPSPARPELAFTAAVAKLVQGKKWQNRWNPIFGKQDSITVSASNFTDYTSLSMQRHVWSPFSKGE